MKGGFKAITIVESPKADAYFRDLWARIWILVFDPIIILMISIPVLTRDQDTCKQAFASNFWVFCSGHRLAAFFLHLISSGIFWSNIRLVSTKASPGNRAPHYDSFTGKCCSNIMPLSHFNTYSFSVLQVWKSRGNHYFYIHRCAKIERIIVKEIRVRLTSPSHTNCQRKVLL